jgi:hypothetical protein
MEKNHILFFVLSALIMIVYYVFIADWEEFYQQ